MSDKKKQSKAGATELAEEDLKKVQGGAFEREGVPLTVTWGRSRTGCRKSMRSP